MTAALSPQSFTELSLQGARGVIMCFEKAASGLIKSPHTPILPHLTQWVCRHQVALEDALH